MRLLSLFHPALLAAALSASGLATPLPALAQPAAVTPKRYDIPAGPLQPALATLARFGGINLSYDAAALEDAVTSGLQGEHGIVEALAMLLAGSGWEAVADGEGYALRRRPAAGTSVTALPSVKVEARLSDAATTEGTGAYTTGQMRSATRLPLSIRETPQSVTVITRERLESENIVDLIDVVDASPGLIVSYNGARPSFQARGFEIDRITQDGLATIHDSYIPGSLGNMAMQDRVEVVRGATGLMQGAGNPSAAVNLIRKRSTGQFQALTSASAGSWNDYRLMADVSGPLGTDERIRARAVGSFQKAETFRDIEEDDNALAYVTVDIDLSERTTLNLGYSHLDIHTNFVWGGIPLAYDGSHLDVPRSTFVGADWEFLDNTANTAYASLDHAFGNGWELKLNAVHVDALTDTLATAVAPTEAAGGYGHVWWAAEKKQKQKAVDLYVSGPVELFGRTHEFVLGGTVNRQESHVVEWFDIWEPTISSGVDFRTWNHSAPRPDTSDDSPYRSDYETYGEQDSLYATVRFAPADPLRLILGGRLDWYERTALWGGNGYEIDAHLTRYAGLTYDINSRHTTYLSYTDVFQPQSERGTDGDYLDPILGENYEIGLKGEYFNGALNTSIALFRLDQTNRARQLDDQSGCPLAPAMYCHEAAGLVRSEGVDLELQGALTADWQIATGFTWSRAEYRKDSDPANIGEPLNTLIPTTQFKLSSEYRMPGALDRLKLGGRLSWQSRIYADATAADETPVRNRQDAYHLLDLFTTYAPTAQLNLQLSVNNVFDKTYYRNIAGEWGSFFYSASGIYGEPRNFLVTAKYRF